MDLTTVDRVQAILNSGGASTDTLTSLITQVITDVSGRVEEQLGRGAESKERTEVFDTEAPMWAILLETFPLVLSPAPVVTYDPERGFTGVDPLDESLYAVDFNRGVIRFDHWWPAEHPRCLMVTYTGGMGADTAGFINAFPMIAHAVDLQVAHLIQRRRALGATGESVGGGSISSIGAYDLLPEVSNIVSLYRRRMV